MTQAGAVSGGPETPSVKRATALPWQLVRKASRRIGWGIADQGMSSITNFAVNIYIARTLGAAEYGAFSLAYVTYAFILNGSRGLSTDPLLVRFSGVPIPAWRRAVASSTGTSVIVGTVSGLVVVGAAMLMHGPSRLAFLALGLTMPGLMLQDSWRFAFFAAGRGVHAFLNDTIWAVVLVPVLILLNHSGHPSVFWYLIAWGGAATVGAAIGSLQAKILPRPLEIRQWLSRHRDLGPRYMLEGTANSGSTQLRNYGVGLLLGLATLGYVQAASTLMGPFMVVFLGMGLVTLPEAARVLRRSPRHLPLFCAAVSAGLTLAGVIWTVAVLVALPRGLGHLMLGAIWRPTYPLVLPLAISILGGCVSAGAGAGLHALGAAKHSLRSMVESSVLYLICGLVGTYFWKVTGTMDGAAIAGVLGSGIFWWHFFVAFRDYNKKRATNPTVQLRPRAGRHRRQAPVPFTAPTPASASPGRPGRSGADK